MLLKDIVEGRQEDDEVGQAHPGAVLDVGVGEEAALPVPRVRVLSTFFSCALHQVAKLAAATDEEDDAASVRYVGCEVEGQLKVLNGLVQIKDVLVHTAAVEIRLHESRQRSILVIIRILYIQNSNSEDVRIKEKIENIQCPKKQWS